MKILFLCVANSSRSQMAEGLARSLFQGTAEVQSAGSQPSQVNPLAVKAMKEIGIDISQFRSKGVEDIDATSVDTVITLCAEEICPAFLENVRKLHWSLPDPAKVKGSPEEKLQAFRNVRNDIQKLLLEFKKESSS